MLSFFISLHGKIRIVRLCVMQYVIMIADKWMAFKKLYTYKQLNLLSLQIIFGKK